MKKSYFEPEKVCRMHPGVSGRSALQSQKVTPCPSSSFCCDMPGTLSNLSVTHRCSAPRSGGHAPRDSPLCYSGQHDIAQNQVPSHVRRPLAHWQQSPSTCSSLDYPVPFVHSRCDAWPSLHPEAFLAIPVPQAPVGTPPLCRHSSQLAEVGVRGYLFHICTFRITHRAGTRLLKERTEEETQGRGKENIDAWCPKEAQPRFWELRGGRVPVCEKGLPGRTWGPNWIY